MTDLFKDIITSITQSKKDFSKEDDFNKTYNSFVVNKSLSFHLDCVMQANKMNMYSNLPNNMQYHFLLNSIRGYKRPFRKWEKRETIDNLEAVKEYYNYSNEKAKDVMVLLDATQIEKIKSKIDKGGIDDNKSRRIYRN